MPDEAPGATTTERRSVSFAKIIAALAVSAVVTGAGAWLAWRELIHYDRRAALHVPPSAEAALRLDVEQVLLFDPVRRHLFPILAALPLGESAARRNSGPDWIRALREDADVNLGRDLRELVYAELPPQDWVIVLGGLFPRYGLMTALDGVLRKHGIELGREGEVLIVRGTGVALGQTSDGLLILASRREALRQALAPARRHEQLGVARKGAGGLGFTAERLHHWLGVPGEPPPGVGPIAGQLHIGQHDLELVVTVQLSQQWITSTYHDVRLETDRPPGSHASAALNGALQRLYESASIRGNSLIMKTLLTAQELDAGVASAARQIELRITSRTPEP